MSAIQNAINSGDFITAQKLLLEAQKNNTVYKKGRLSKKEIEKIKELSSSGATTEEISLQLQRKEEVVKKYIVPTVKNKTTKNNLGGTKSSGPVEFTGNTWADSGEEAVSDKKIDKALSLNVQKTERRNCPNKISVICSNCGKKDSVSPALANYDPEKREYYIVCKNCLSEKRSKYR